MAGLFIGGFVTIQFTPAAPFLNAALLLLSGIEGATEFINFFRKASAADSIEDLYDAVSHVPRFLQTLFDIPGAGSELSHLLGAIGSIDNALDAFRRFFQSIDTFSLPDITRIGASVGETSVDLFTFLNNIVQNGLGDISEGFVALFTASINLFKSQDSPLSRLLQHADAQVIDNLVNVAVGNFPQNPENADQILTFLSQINTRWERVNAVATRLDELPYDTVIRWLDEYPFLYGDIFDFDVATNQALIDQLRNITQSFTLEDFVRIEAPERPIKVLPHNKRTSTNPDDLIELTSPIFLEIGNNTRLPDATNPGDDRGVGLVHIIGKHAEDFKGKEIPEDRIIEVIFAALQRGENVGYQINPGRQVYKVNLEAELGIFRSRDAEEYIAITVGDNGFIVGANPTSVDKITFYN